MPGQPGGVCQGTVVASCSPACPVKCNGDVYWARSALSAPPPAPALPKGVQLVPASVPHSKHWGKSPGSVAVAMRARARAHRRSCSGRARGRPRRGAARRARRWPRRPRRSCSSGSARSGSGTPARRRPRRAVQRRTLPTCALPAARCPLRAACCVGSVPGRAVKRVGTGLASALMNAGHWYVCMILKHCRRGCSSLQVFCCVGATLIVIRHVPEVRPAGCPGCVRVLLRTPMHGSAVR